MFYEVYNVTDRKAVTSYPQSGAAYRAMMKAYRASGYRKQFTVHEHSTFHVHHPLH